MSATLELAVELLRCPSITPVDAGCQEILITRLTKLGFTIERLPFGAVTNFWARRGHEEPLFCFAGHSDVVPPGPLATWHSAPFQPEVRGGYLYGRGAADMKGGLAAMLTAVETFIAQHPQHRGSLAFLVTSDEEAEAIDGTARVIQHLEARGEKIDFCLLAEPTSSERAADVIKPGRRGSLNGRLRVIGKQGHVAHPQLACNPFHASVPELAALCAEIWDQGNAYFPPTQLQISNMNMGTGAENVIPGELAVWFNFRFSTAIDTPMLQRRVEEILNRGGFHYELSWIISGQPFLTPAGALIAAGQRAVREIVGVEPELSTGGGTSDGRFIAPTGAQVLEIGPCNTTIHQQNECVAIADLDILARIYHRLLELLLN